MAQMRKYWSSILRSLCTVSTNEYLDNDDDNHNNNRKWITGWVSVCVRESMKLYEIGTKIQFNIHKVAIHISISFVGIPDRFQATVRVSEHTPHRTEPNSRWEQQIYGTI